MGVLSYAAAFLGFLILGAWILIGNRGGRPARLVSSACLISAGWAALASLATTSYSPGPIFLAFAEPIHSMCWIAVLLFLPAPATPGPGNAQSESVGRLRHGGLIIASVLLTLSLTSDFLGLGERMSFASKIMLSVFGLVCIEQLYRNTPGEQRWSIKLLCIALGALFAFDITMYSDALLFGQLKFSWWAARGFACLAALPLIGMTLARSKNWGVGLAVSRSVAFHSAALLVSGAYLLILSFGAYWASLVGGGWGEVLQATIAFIALLSLMVILLSAKVRAWLRVTVYKNFFRLRYDYREEWLKFTRVMTPPAPDSGTAAVTTAGARAGAEDTDSTAKRALAALAELVQANHSALYLRSEDQTFVLVAGDQSAVNPLPAQLHQADSLVTFLQQRDWVVSAQEYERDKSIYGDLNLPAWCQAPRQSVIVAPIRVDDALLGIAVLWDLRVALEVDWEVRDILKAMGRQAASYLAQEEAVKALLVARQFESFNRMSAFVVHDLKNLVAQLSLMVDNSERHKHNPEFQEDMLLTVQNVLDRMRGLLLQLRAGTKPVEAPALVNLAKAVKGAIQAKPGLRVVPQLHLDQPEAIFVTGHADRLERVIGHLIQNASEALGADGRIEVRTCRIKDEAVLEVKDNGKGMSQEFISLHLFKPFESTKAHGMGIGAFESREYIRELGGRLEVESTEGSGTSFVIRLALATAHAAATLQPSGLTGNNNG